MSLVARPRGNGNQHNCSRIPDTLLYILLFPDGHTSAAGYDELERRHVWRYLSVGYRLLCDQREEGVYTTCEDCEAGYIVDIRVKGGLLGKGPVEREKQRENSV